jgi:hypothetical protein
MPEETVEKRNTGYTYWKRDIVDAHLLPSSIPQKISHSSSEESLSAGNRTSSSGLVSAWNAGTTYEEKNITERAKKILAELLLKRFVANQVLTMTNLKGEVHAHHVRGKVKIGYEISELDLCASDGRKAEVKDVDSTDVQGLSIKSDGGFGKSELRAFVVQLMNDMCSTLLTTE